MWRHLVVCFRRHWIITDILFSLSAPEHGSHLGVRNNVCDLVFVFALLRHHFCFQNLETDLCNRNLNLNVTYFVDYINNNPSNYITDNEWIPSDAVIGKLTNSILEHFCVSAAAINTTLQFYAFETGRSEIYDGHFHYETHWLNSSAINVALDPLLNGYGKLVCGSHVAWYFGIFIVISIVRKRPKVNQEIFDNNFPLQWL